MRRLLLPLLAAASSLPALAQTAPAPRPDQLAFRDLYKELVEIDTSVSTGSCTKAAEMIAGRLRAAGFEGDSVQTVVPDGFPLDGNVVARLDGTDRKAKAMLLLGHIDVVNARREDWTRDPFAFIEENGYFYGRGTGDMKALAATWVDTLIRLKQSGFKPRRTIRLALTCGEESGARVNGAQYLTEKRPELVNAAFALNEGGGGVSDANGKVLYLRMQVGEKSNRNYELTTTNPGGHSSNPQSVNAIYQLADALAKVRAKVFPVRLNDTTRSSLAAVGALRPDAMGAAMVALAANPDDAAARAALESDQGPLNILRTTCVATQLEGGHAANALPQRATANINCRIAPGEDENTTREALVAAIGDPGVSVKLVGRLRPIAVPPPLTPKIMEPARTVAAKYFPGVPVIPSMSAGATDATFMKMPTYGVPGAWVGPEGSRAHGLNERMSVQAVYGGRDYLFDLVKIYAMQK